MDKKKIVFASTLALLIAPSTLGSLSDQATPIQAAALTINGTTINDPIGTVDYGGVNAVDSTGKQINLFLPGKSSWKLGNRIVIAGQVYYAIGANEYVSLENITITDGAPKPAPILIKNLTQTGTLKYAVKVVNQYGSATNNVLPASSSWKISNMYSINGNPYYRVAVNEYVPVAAVNLNQTTNIPSTTKKTGTLLAAAKVVDANGQATGITLPAGSAWQLGNSVNLGGTYYYAVATNEFIPVSLVHVNGTHAADKPSTPDTNGTANPVNTTVNLYNASQVLDDNGNDTGKTLPANSSWHADQTKTMHNYLYYRVAPNQWVTNGGYYGSEHIFSNGPVDVTLTKDVQLYNTETNTMTRTLAKGTSWKVVQSVQNYNGQFFIQVSSNEWIPMQRGLFVDYSDGNTLFNGFAYSATYEPQFATNLAR